MSDKAYVIRGYHFGYNDECFGKCGDYKVASFETKEEAEKVYKKLEIKDARQFPLKDMEFVMCSDEDKLQELDAFVYEKCGQHILNDDELIDDVLPRQLSDEDTFEFINKANAHAYQLVEFSDEEANKKYWVAYFPENEEYLSVSREWVNGVQVFDEVIIYSKDKIGILSKIDLERDLVKFWGKLVIWNNNKCIKIKGKLEELSCQPLLLKQLIEQNKSDLSYSKDNLIINVGKAYIFWSVNELLTQPIIEIKSLNERELNDIGVFID